MGSRQDQTHPIMKTRAALFLFLIAVVAGAFWFSVSVFAEEKTPAAASQNVVIKADGIVIPGTQISKADHDAMNRILNKYDKALYRIDTYENGKLKKTQGKLTDVVTDKRLASQIAANVKKAGFTQYAVQIRAGSTTNVQTSPTPGATTHVQTSPTPGFTTHVQTSPTPGFTTHVQTSPRPGSTTNVQISPTPGATTHPQKPKSNESTERLRSILKKYQKK